MSEKKHTNRQALRSRKMLQDALLELMKKKTYAKITITEIAESAGLARPTFYAHFETKDDLLLSYVDDIFDAFFGALVDNAPHILHPPTYLELQARFLEEWQENAEILRLIRTADIDLFIMNRLKQYHLQTYESIIAPQYPELSPTLAGYYVDFLAGATFGILRHWMDEKMRHSPDIISDMLGALTGPDRSRALVEAVGTEIG